MSLIHWSTIIPENDLAAIRFSVPVHVSHIIIVPNGSHPFSQLPDIVAETQPESFFADLYFNAQPTTPQSQLRDKQRPPNALVPTRIAYFGSRVNFTVDMGLEYSTRLLIIQGSFEKLSLAIYGTLTSDTVTGTPHLVTQPIPNTSSDSLPLPETLDPCNAAHPTDLARHLLSLVSEEPPPLSLIIQLVFCLKPDPEDWDHPDFPFLYSDLTKEVEEDNLSALIKETMRPADDSVSIETMRGLAENLAETLRAKGDGSADIVAQLLNNVAPQKAELTRILLEYLDLDLILSSQKLDKFILGDLLNAANNFDIAQKLNTDICNDLLAEIQNSSSFDEATQLAAKRVREKASGWMALSETLLGTADSYAESSLFLKDICLDDLSLGIWLASMLNNASLMECLTSSMVSAETKSLPPHLWSQLQPIHPQPTRAGFLSFVCGLVGVAGVLATLSWVDSLGNDEARQHILSILHLWQGVDGYDQMVSHLMLMRQFTRRLEWITADNDPPRKSGYIGEQIIFRLAQDPCAILRPQFTETLKNLQAPLTRIPEHERLSLRKIALVASDGLPAAVEELTFISNRPISLRRIRTIRVALAVLETQLREPDGVSHLMHALHNEDCPSLMDGLGATFLAISEDLALQLQSYILEDIALSEHLCFASHEILSAIQSLEHVLPLTSRCLRIITKAIIGTCVTSGAVQKVYPGCPVARAAEMARVFCYEFISELSIPSVRVEPDTLASLTILRTLITDTPQNTEQDPVEHTVQILTLIDHVLTVPKINNDPKAPNLDWPFDVFPHLMPELSSFFQTLSPNNKIRLIQHFFNLDEDSQMGLVEWILTEDFNQLLSVIRSLDSFRGFNDPYKPVSLYSIHVSLQFLSSLFTTPSWSIPIISSSLELSTLLSQILIAFLDQHCEDQILEAIVLHLTPHFDLLSGPLQFALSMAQLRVSSADTFKSIDAVAFFKRVPPDCLVPASLISELGATLLRLSKSKGEISTETAENILELLVWYVENMETRSVSGITLDLLSTFCEDLCQVLSADSASKLQEVKEKLAIDEDRPMTDVDPIPLPSEFPCSVEDLRTLLNPSDDPPPSTPQNGHKTPDAFGVIMSPSTALLRSYTSTGLTKTYTSNEFREPRVSPTTRQNASRFPSTHVDVGMHVA